MIAPFPSYAEMPPTRVGGTLALDFVNTVEWRGDPGARGERLNAFAELALWAEHAGLLDRKAARALIAEAARRPAEATRALDAARALREAIAHLLVRPERPGRADLARVNGMLGGQPAIVAADGGFAWAEDASDALTAMLPPIARDAAALLTSDRLARVRRCADPRCGWMFLDTGRGPGRRWCSMAGCGNRAKARRHYRRALAVSPARPGA